MNRTVIAILLATAALIAAGAGYAQQKEMYQWTDEHGVVHFSDSPPPGREVAPQALPQGDPPASADNPERDAAVAPSSSVAQQRREEIAQKSRDAKAEQTAMATRCSAWQAEVARLEPSRRVYFTNEQGETERMDDVVRTDRVAELKALIEQNC